MHDSLKRTDPRMVEYNSNLPVSPLRLQIVPRFGPLNGRISVTIKGSNMGIKKEDIKKITVAGVDCVHQKDRYSVSTR